MANLPPLDLFGALPGSAVAKDRQKVIETAAIIAAKRAAQQTVQAGLPPVPSADMGMAAGQAGLPGGMGLPPIPGPPGVGVPPPTPGGAMPPSPVAALAGPSGAAAGPAMPPPAASVAPPPPMAGAAAAPPAAPPLVPMAKGGMVAAGGPAPTGLDSLVVPAHVLMEKLAPLMGGAAGGGGGGGAMPMGTDMGGADGGAGAGMGPMGGAMPGAGDGALAAGAGPAAGAGSGADTEAGEPAAEAGADAANIPPAPARFLTWLGGTDDQDDPMAGELRAVYQSDPDSAGRLWQIVREAAAEGDPDLPPGLAKLAGGGGKATTPTPGAAPPGRRPPRSRSRTTSRDASTSRSSLPPVPAGIGVR